MIYRKSTQPRCGLCKHATITDNSLNVICDIKGKVPSDFACKKYSYDIFKREIKSKSKIKSFKKEDFEI